MSYSYGKMKCVIHQGPDFDKAVKDLQDKRISIVMDYLSSYDECQIKIIKQGLKLQKE